jgi:hypothetical protein
MTKIHEEVWVLSLSKRGNLEKIRGAQHVW